MNWGDVSLLKCVKLEKKAGERDRECWQEVEFYNFPKSSLTRVNFLEKMIFGQRFEGDEGESQLNIWGMSRLC